MSAELQPERPGVHSRLTLADLPRIVATVLGAGIATLVVVALFLLPPLEEGREESRNVLRRRYCLKAKSILEAIPPDDRLMAQEIIGRNLPNQVVLNIVLEENQAWPVRAVLTDPGGQIVRIYIPEDVTDPVAPRQHEHTLESTEASLAQVRSSRRRQWITAIAVWLVSWSLVSVLLMRQEPGAAKRLGHD